MTSRSPTSPHSNPIPSGWHLVSLGEVAFERNQRANNAPITDVFSVTKHFGFVRSLDYFDRQVFSRDTSKYKVVRRGDLAYATIHLDEGSLGILRDADTGLISPMYTVFEVDKTQANPEFLFSLMKLPQMVALYQRIGEGSITRRKSIRFDRLGRLRIAIPPLPEQRAITEVLDSIDEAIEKTEAVLAATENLRDALLHRLLTRGVPGWHSEWKEVRGIGTIPATWDVVLLGGECIHVGSGVTPRGGKSAYVPEGIVFLRSQNVHFEGLRLGDVAYISQKTDESMRRSRVLQGDVLLNITGASIGRCTIVPKNLGPANVNQHVCIIRTTRAFNRYFVTKWLSTPRSQREIDDLQVGQSRQGLNYGQIRQIRIVKPPRFEQDRIAEMLVGVDATIEQGRAEIEMLQSLKASATDALLTGRVRVRKCQ